MSENKLGKERKNLLQCKGTTTTINTTKRHVRKHLYQYRENEGNGTTADREKSAMLSRE